MSTEEWREQLLQDVGSIPAGMDISELAVVGEHASPILMGRMKDRNCCLAAAALHESGRMVAFGHPGFLGQEEEYQALLGNCLRWVSGEEAPAVLILGVDGLAEHLNGRGYTAVESGHSVQEALEQAPETRVVVFSRDSLSPEEEEALLGWVSGGGGLLCAGLGWAYQARDHEGAAMPQNRLFAPVGISWSATTSCELTEPLDPFQHGPEGVHLGGVNEMLARVLLGEEEVSEEHGRQLSAQARILRECYGPDSNAIVREAARDAFENRREELTPSEAQPLSQERWLDRLRLFWLNEYWRLLPPDEVPVCPATADFPGDVPEDAEETEVVVVVRAGDLEEWVCTGVYARAGRAIEVVLPPEAIELGLRVRIGAHFDELYSENELSSGCHNDLQVAEAQDWIRWPDLSFEWPLTQESTRVASPWGGLIFLLRPGEKPMECEVTLRSVVLAPSFVLGETTPGQWRQEIRHHPAPWGELRSSRMVFVGPSSALREIENPELIMQGWERAMGCFEELTGRPFKRPELIVFDRQISLGDLHSGYPIAGKLGFVSAMLNPRAFAEAHLWGQLHEIGHNLQLDEWTFAGTEEVTNNLMVLYVMECLSGIPAWDVGLMPSNRQEAIDFYESHPTSQRWRDEDAFFAKLHMFAQLQREFGWTPFKRFFRDYLETPEGERPREDEAKRDQWLLRFSRLVGRNLGPFFTRWGMETSDDARQQVEDLPPWEPEPLQ